MAMNPSSMKTRIENYMTAAGVSVEEPNQLLALCQGIIDEITQNGDVKAGIPVTTSAGSGQTTQPGKIE